MSISIPSKFHFFEIDHPLFICLNIVFRDIATPSPFRDVLFKGELNLMDDPVYLDSPVGGLGCCCCCCLQITFQAQPFDECLKLYDQLLPLTGIMVCCCFTNIVIMNGDMRILVSSEWCLSNLARFSNGY
jgi:hypothetical protein